MSSFARQLRISKFASIEGNTEAALITSANKANYGLKYDLPKALTSTNTTRITTTIKPKELDNGYKFFRFIEANEEEGRFEMIKDLLSRFNSTNSRIRVLENQDLSSKNVGEMSREEWEELKNKILSCEELKQEISKDESRLNMKYILEYFKNNSHGSFSSGSKVTIINPKDIKVKGRVLNVIKDGFVIGTCGITAHLPSTHPQYYNITGWDATDRRKVYDFYIEEISMTSGEIVPQIKLSLRKPTWTQSTTSSGSSSNTSDSIDGKEHDLAMLLDEMSKDTKDKKPVRHKRNKVASDNREFLSKLSDLLKELSSNKTK